MRQFASSGFRIWNLSREAKLVYTGFGLFALLAMAVSMMFYEDLVGARSAGVAGYYAGARAAAAPAAPGDGTSVKIELPDEAASERITVAVTYRKLLEVTHFHLFTVPVFLLIIAHLFMLTGVSSTVGAVADPLRRARLGVAVSAVGGGDGAGADGDDGLSDRRHVAAAAGRGLI